MYFCLECLVYFYLEMVVEFSLSFTISFIECVGGKAMWFRRYIVCGDVGQWIVHRQSLVYDKMWRYAFAPEFGVISSIAEKRVKFGDKTARIKWDIVNGRSVRLSEYQTSRKMRGDTLHPRRHVVIQFLYLIKHCSPSVQTIPHCAISKSEINVSGCLLKRLQSYFSI